MAFGCGHCVAFCIIREMAAWGYPPSLARVALIRRLLKFSLQYRHG